VLYTVEVGFGVAVRADELEVL